MQEALTQASANRRRKECEFLACTEMRTITESFFSFFAARSDALTTTGFLEGIGSLCTCRGSDHPEAFEEETWHAREMSPSLWFKECP